MPKKTPKQTKFLINDNIYRADIYVYIGGTVTQAASHLNKKTEVPIPTDYGDSSFHACVIAHKGFKDVGVWFKYPKPPGGVVAHEILHVAHHILGYSGLTLTDSSEEAYAYYIGWLTRQIGNKVW